MRPCSLTSLFALAALALIPFGVAAQDNAEVECDSEAAAAIGAMCPDDTEKVLEAAKKKSSIKDYKETVEGKTLIEGLFDLYRDEEKGDVFLALDEDQLEQEFIYFSYIQNGTGASSLRRQGQVADNAVYIFKRRFNRLDVIQRSTRFTFDEDSPLARKPARNNPDTVVASLKITAETPDESRILVEANPVFTGKGFVQLPRGGVNSILEAIAGPDVLRPSKEKSSVVSIRNYPRNVEIVSDYVFDRAKTSTASQAAETVTVQHNFVAMPDDGFVPRRDDFRVGFFTQQRNNLTQLEGLPYDDLIRRWRLEKKDPTAAISDPVTPIIFWIENTTPLEFRETIREAALLWNVAFEKAGFSNAIRVEIQPDDADWDAGDLRYNVLQWVSTPFRTYLGYGPSFTNPRTGEIIGADIVLEHASVRRTETLQELWGFEPVGGDGASAPHGGHYHADGTYCASGHYLNLGRSFGETLLAARSAGPDVWADEEEMTRQGLFYLVLHEVGHTLGLTHNMMGSYYLPIEALNGENANPMISNSVMEYPAINIARKGQKQGAFFPTMVGPYDEWAIRFGYDPAFDDDDAREEHLLRSTDPSLVFGNDADVLRIGFGPDSGIDPRVQVFDLSTDPMGYSAYQMELVRETLPLLKDRLLVEGESYDRLRNGVLSLLGTYRSAAFNIGRFIGGIKVERSVVGQDTRQDMPHEPISGDEQRRAIALLNEYVLRPGAVEIDPELLGMMQMQRRGFAMFGQWQDASIHALLRNIASASFFQVTNPRTLRRLGDTTLYGNDYTAMEMLGDMTEAVFEADIAGSVDTHRAGMQIDYVRTLLRSWRSGRHDAMSEAALLAQLEEIGELMERAQRRGDDATRAHRRYVQRLVEEGLDPSRGS